METLSGKRVLVSGGTTGIGLAIARHYANLGAKVALFSRDQSHVDQALATMPGAIGRTADVGKDADVKALFAWIEGEWGGLDILINNAGVSGDSVTDTDFASWHDVIHTNLVGVMNLAGTFAPLIPEGGHIVNIGSVSAKERGGSGNVYVATKSGLQGFSEALGKKLIEKKIRVCNVEPGMTESEMTRPNVDSVAQEKKELKMLEADDVARLVIFITSQGPAVNIPLVRIQPLDSDD